MTRHVDYYGRTGGFASAEWLPEPVHREDEGSIGFDNAIARGLPYFNGYIWYTEPHTDDECEVHRPKGRVWGDSVKIEYDETNRCPLCDAPTALNGPFAGCILHKGGCDGKRYVS